MIVLVTGASSGFGTAIARIFIDAGHRVIAAARRTDRLQSLSDELGPMLLPIMLDLRERAALSKLPESLPRDFVDVDVLVNITRAFLPGMMQRNRGHIINIGSTAGRYPYPGANVYGASKAFVRQFSLNLRADLAGTALRVTNIEPGLCGGTEFSTVRFKGDTTKAAALYQDTQPLTAEDVAEAAYWVATRPAHVNINTVELMPVAQSFSALYIHRQCRKDGCFRAAGTLTRSMSAI